MKIITKNINFNNKYSKIINKDYKNYIFFDIETTGFSPKNSTLYLIGMLYFENNDSVCLTQIFIESLNEEKQALLEFLSIIKNFEYIISFNGETFDFPFIKACMKNYSIDFSLLSTKSSIDLYKIARKFKLLLRLDKTNQTSIENFLGIYREDKYNGGQLINIYKDYISTSCRDKEALYKLLLHNECDILGLISLSILIDLNIFFKSDFSFMSYDDIDDSIILNFKADISTPFNLEINLNEFKIKIENEYLFLFCPKFIGKLKYFIEDYKNYFYLPSEDICIHKDIAAFVDKDAKVKAKRETAFLIKDAIFMGFYGENSLKKFKVNYISKEVFIDMADLNFDIHTKELLDNILSKHKLK